MTDILKFYSLSEIDYRHKYPLIEKIKYFAKGILLYFVLQICALLLMLLVDEFLIKKMGFTSVFKLLKRNPKIETAIGKRQKIITMLSVVLFGLLHISNIETLHWELALLYPVYALPQMILGYVSSVQRLKLGFVWGLLFHSMINLMAFLR